MKRRFNTVVIGIFSASLSANPIFAQDSSISPIPAGPPHTSGTGHAQHATLPPEMQEVMEQLLKQHPDFKLIGDLTKEMVHQELRTQDHSARDKLVRYARDVSHDEMTRGAAVDSISAIISDDNLKLTASFLTDPSIEVRCRAYSQLPHEIQIGMGLAIGDFDYTRSPYLSPAELSKIDGLIGGYTKGKKPRLNGDRSGSGPVAPPPPLVTGSADSR